MIVKMPSHDRKPENHRVYLVEQHLIHRDDTRFMAIDEAAFKSKNLYNRTLYLIRQSYVAVCKYPPYHELHNEVKHDLAYQALPAKVAQQVMMQVYHDWDSFLAALKAYRRQPDQFRGQPRLPKYKHKQGRCLLTYTDQAISRKKLKKGVIAPSGLGVDLHTQQEAVHQVRIVPRKGHYVVEVVHSVKPEQLDLNPDWVAAVDLGLNHLAALTSNQPGFIPLLVTGRPLKSINLFYNEQRARLQAQLPFGQHTSHRLDNLNQTRNRRIKHYLHTASRRIIDYLIRCRISTLIIGKNKGWKQEINLGKQTNQNFVFMPHTLFVDLLTYKAELAGITIVVREESYTSKCSFLDNEPICKHTIYQGKRIRRGLFRASDGRLINADVNASYNILRKESPNAIRPSYGGEGVVVHPVRVTLSQMQSDAYRRSVK
jgi:putative transposase